METNNNSLQRKENEGAEVEPKVKIIGVGGGGCNAVNYMYRKGIRDVKFVVCDMDSKALADSPVPNRLQLDTDGIGTNNNPLLAEWAAEDSVEVIRHMYLEDTRIALITAGMGGGTGMGAAPIIAREAKEMGILTVGIVTIPFLLEGKIKIERAWEGVRKIAKHVDALVVFNNESLPKIYPDLNILNAFERADDTLWVAAKSIAETLS